MSASPRDEDDVGEGEWRFGLDDVDENGIVEPQREAIEPGSPSVENTVFVVLGVALTLAVLYASVSGVL
jgi:hypothetical protein